MELLTPQEVREILGVGHVKIYEMLRNQEIPVVSIGKKYRIPKDALEEWIKKNTKGVVIGGAVVHCAGDSQATKG